MPGLWWAAEEAKKKLSFEPYVRVREEALLIENGKPLHLDLEISRDEYEEMIRPLIESTLDSVSKALGDARKSPGDLDAILLVGGSTRTPLIAQRLQELTNLEPRQDVHPDLCVALGAGVLASRLAGHEVERVLVDVSPFSFGPSYLGERGGFPYPHCYHPIIHRNTPLPVTRTDQYCTALPYQTVVQVEIYQGEDEDALKNILVGDFLIEGLRPTEEPNEVLCRMSLDVDGILHVTAIEKGDRQVQAHHHRSRAAGEERSKSRRPGSALRHCIHLASRRPKNLPRKWQRRTHSALEGAEVISGEEGTEETEEKVTAVSATPLAAERRSEWAGRAVAAITGYHAPGG